MIAYDYICKENVSELTFLSNIELAKKTLREKNNLDEDSIYQVNDRLSINYTIENIEYTGRLIEYEIKSESYQAFLNCFISDKNDCFGIFTYF